MSDIFVSYANEDQGRIMPLVRALEAMGWSVFWDRTIPVGSTWRHVIGTEIDACRCMVVVWSQHSIDSSWVHEEADEGKRRGVLAPVLIDDILPPIGFRSIQAAKLAGWDGKVPSVEFDRLLSDLTRLLGTAPAKVEEEQERHVDNEIGQARKQERNRAEEQPWQAAEAKRKAEEESRRGVREESQCKTDMANRPEVDTAQRMAAPAPETRKRLPNKLIALGGIALAAIFIAVIISVGKREDTLAPEIAPSIASPPTVPLDARRIEPPNEGTPGAPADDKPTERDAYKRIFYEGFDTVPASAEAKSIWLVGRRADWEGTFPGGMHRLCNVARNQTASFTNRLTYLLPSQIDPVDLSNAKVSVRVRIEPPNTTHSGGGICYRAARDRPDYLAFVVNAGHGVSLLRRTPKDLKVLWSGEIAKEEQAEFVTLKIVGSDSGLELFINDRLVHRARNIDLLTGDPGIMAYSLGCFVFDDFALYVSTH